MATVALKILLLQARNQDDPVRQEERRSFAAKTGLALEQVVPWDLLGGPPTLTEARMFDAVMVGGSGDYYVSNRSLPHFEAQLDFVGEIVATGHPMFASCFGFHILVQALGGEIIHDPANTEVGTYELTLTCDGQRDELLGRLPRKFAAQMGRKDRAYRLPPGALHLASSERNPYQALRIPGQPIWTTQFHPELDEKTNRGRFLRYMSGYAAHMTPRERQEALDNRFGPSPETDRLLPAFLRLVFG